MQVSDIETFLWAVITCVGQLSLLLTFDRLHV